MRAHGYKTMIYQKGEKIKYGNVVESTELLNLDINGVNILSYLSQYMSSYYSQAVLKS